MSFVTHDVIEIEASQYRAVARVRNVMEDRIHVAFETGYIPWTDDRVLVRRLGEAPETAVAGRILHASGQTAMIELGPMAHNARDTVTDET